MRRAASLVPRGPWTTRPAVGSRVVPEGQLRIGEGAIPTMIVSRVHAHGIARGLLTAFLDAQVRVSGGVWPARISPSREPLGRPTTLGALDSMAP